MSNFPACDAEITSLAADLWGVGAAPAELCERHVGKGRILWGGQLSPKVAAAPSQPPELGSAQWIWYPEGKPAQSAPPGKRYFRRVLTLDAGSRIASAWMVMTADNEFVCYLNGHRMGTGDNFKQAHQMNVASALKPGENLIAVMATNTTDNPSPAGLIGMLSIKLSDGRKIELRTDGSWETSLKAARGWNSSAKPGAGWMAAMQLGPLGMGPWGEIEVAPAVEDVFPPATVVHQWLAHEGLPPDFLADHPLRFIHRRIGEADVYFVANGSAEGCEATCSFRIAGKQPELWHPENGSIAPLAAYVEKDGCTHVPLRLGPTESVFIVFRRPAEAAGRIVSVTRDGRELLHIAPPAAVAEAGPGSLEHATDESRPGQLASATAPRVVNDSLTLDLLRGEIWQQGSYRFKTADGRSREVQCPRLAAPQEIDGPWDVAFDPHWGGPAKVRFEKLEDWSRRAEEGIKYYSGAASYRTTFNVSAAAMAQSGGRWYLDLGKVAVMAEVRVNGKDLGIAWKTPYRLEVTDALKPGENVLDVKVVNLWINRQIGDEQLPDDCDRNPNGTLKRWPQWLQDGKPSPTGRYTFSSWKLWKKGDPLKESGLLGPVTLRQAVQIEQ